MASWSRRRKAIYVFIVLIIVIAGIGIPGFFIIYKAPTCSDGLRNGNELGVDCGGSCTKLCASAFLPPSAAWTRFEKVAPGLYNVATYVINPNTEGAAKGVPYHMVLFDAGGVPIIDKQGQIDLPPHRNTLAFMGAVPTGKNAPVKALFEFTGAPDWFKATDPLSAIQVAGKDYTEEASSSLLRLTLKNSSAYPAQNIAVSVVLYDPDSNAIGFSRTIIDEIPARSSVDAPFTWPVSRHGRVVSIEALPVAE